MQENEELSIVKANHEKSFIEKYDGWKEMMDSINNNIRHNINTLGIPASMFENDLFTYNDFCQTYIKKIEFYFIKNQQLTADEIDIIVNEMIVEKLDIIKKSNLDVMNFSFLQDFNKNYALGRYV